MQIKTSVSIVIVGWIPLLAGAATPRDAHQMRAVLSEAQDAQARADAAFHAQHLTDAASAYEQSITQFEQIGRPKDAAYPRHQLGIAHWKLGNLSAALSNFQENLAHFLAIGDRQSQGEYHYYMAQIFEQQNKREEAVRNYEMARRLVEDDYSRMADIDHGLVRHYERAGVLAEGRRVLERSKQTIPEAHWTESLAEDWHRLAMDAWSRRFDRFVRAYKAGLVGAGLFVILAGLFLAFRPSRRFMARFCLTVGAVVIALGAAELVLRWISRPPVIARHFLHPPNRTTRFRPASGLLPGVDYSMSQFTTNEIGLRGDPAPPAGTLNVLAIGGSTTEALFLDDADAWPKLLQDLLEAALNKKVWVGNAGKSGLTSFGHIVQLRIAARELNPDMVIVMAGINDLSVCISGNRIGSGAPVSIDGELARSVFHRIAPPLSERPFRLVDLVLRSPSTLSPLIDGQHRDYVVQDEAGLFYVEQRARRAEAKRVDDRPQIDRCLDDFEANLKQMVRFAKRQGIEIVLLTQGSLYRRDLSLEEEALLWFGGVDRDIFADPPPESYYSAAVLAELLNAFNERTRIVAEAHRIPFLDVDTVLPKTTASYYDDVHLNPEGSRRLASSLARLLVSSE